MLDPVLKADQPQPVGLQALLKDWGIDADNDIVLDVSGMGRLIGTDESVPVAAQLSAASDHRELQPADGLPAGALDDADRGRRQRPHGAAAGRDQPRTAGAKPISRA